LGKYLGFKAPGVPLFFGRTAFKGFSAPFAWPKLPRFQVFPLPGRGLGLGPLFALGIGGLGSPIVPIAPSSGFTDVAEAIAPEG